VFDLPWKGTTLLYEIHKLRTKICITLASGGKVMHLLTALMYKCSNKLECLSLISSTKGGKRLCTIDLLFDWFGISCMTTHNFCFYLQNRLIQTSQTGGQWYSDTSPFSIPCSTFQSWFIWVRRCRRSTTMAPDGRPGSPSATTARREAEPVRIGLVILFNI
jgi:hypothetical protein